MSNIIELAAVSKAYGGSGTKRVEALQELTFDLPQGESLAIIGTSGSGKSTLLHLLGGLDTPTSGTVVVAGQEVHKLRDKQLAKFRNQTIGFIFQFFNLHDYLTAEENVVLPQILAGKKTSVAKQRARELLDRVGLSDRLHHKPKQMSGGEMQRVAIARALANEPKLILADEPTGNLDKENADRILEIFDQIASTGVSIVTITHDETISNQFKNKLKLHKGKLVD